MKFIHNDLFPTYSDLLHHTKLESHYTRFLKLYSEASTLLINGKKRDAFNLLNQLWLDPHIVPALILGECYKIGYPVIPTWSRFSRYTLVNKPKLDGSTRPIIAPNNETRVAMGVVNVLLQASCASWTIRTHGFRASSDKSTRFGTKSATLSLSQAFKAGRPSATLVFFDIKKAFNSVDLKHLFNTLELHQLPKDIKHLIWQWQHTPPHEEGLAQGFPYSPTLFAWYLDTVFSKTFGRPAAGRPDFFIYTDNIVGLFNDVTEAQRALDQLNMALAAAGLTINQASLQLITVNNSSADIVVPWLGHKMHFPSGLVEFGRSGPTQVSAEKSRLTKLEWYKQLKLTDWYHKVHVNNWRRLS